MLALATTTATGALDWALASPALTAILLGLGYIVYTLANLLIVEPLRSPLEALPGPPKPGKFFDMRDIQNAMNTIISAKKQQELREKYGKNIRIQGFGYWDQRLLTFDTRAINYVLTQATEMYPKAWQSRRLLSRLLGDGVAVTEGEQHKRQRKVIAPAFAPSALRRMDPVFHNKAEELRDRWSGLVGAQETLLDINHWMSRATFDAFALAGFDYNLGAIQTEDHELYLAYKKMFDAAVNKGQTALGFLEIYFPILGKIIPNETNRQVKKSQAVIQKAGEDMLKEKRDAILRSKSSDNDSEKFPVSKDQRDILSLLIKANLNEAAPKQRLTDAEILAQIHSFLFVGSDSVSLSISWTLYYLSLNPSIQTRLREELLNASSSDIASLPVLDQVVRETLRLTPPVQSSMRVASQDDVIPTEDGQGVRIRKGQFVHLPFEGFNVAKEIWGEDAWEFNPDRWTNLPESARRNPGIMSNLMTFSIGPHSCPGTQFAVMEIKAFLSKLLPAFEFAPSGKRIAKINVIVTRPFVFGEWKQGTQLPMLVKPYAPSA